MRKFLLSTASAGIAILLSATLHAQIKGDPSFNTAPQQPTVQKSSSKLSPVLEKLYNNTANRKAQRPGDKPIVPDALEKYLQIKGDAIVVDITVKDDMPATKTALQQAGLKITGVYGRVISGIIPINALPKLTAINSIKFAKPAYKPMHQSKSGTVFMQQCNTTIYGGKPVPVVSQGDTAQRSYLARKKYNVNGKGVKVGILSDSYDNLGTAAAGVINGELPGPGNPFNFKKPVDVLEDLDDGTGTDEGRGMAEIVHDVAPGAEIAFHTAYLGEADFAQGIQDLAQKGCKVIADDIFYYDEPFFQDGIVAQSVDLAKKKGVTYFSSAGNDYNNSYESDYRATTAEVFGPDFGTAHNFSAPGTAPRYFQPIYVPLGGSFVLSFQWDQPTFSAGGAGAESDFDIFLTDIYGNIVAGSFSDNIGNGDPVEIFGFDNNTANNTFFLTIFKYSGPDVSRLKYIMYGNSQFYLTTNPIPGILAPTVVGHAKAAGAIATGAAFYLNTPAYGVDTPKIDWYSSLGGVANYFDVAGNRIAPVVRKKPEITAPDGGNTSFFDPFGDGDIPQDADLSPNFFGTSAAAPHAAGVAALMIEAEKLNNLTPAQIKGVLSANTVDMDNIYTTGFDKGFDFNTGYGLIKADAAVGAVKFPNLYIKDLKLKAICSDNPSTSRNWKITNPNPFEVEAHWLLLGSNQHGSITAPPGESNFSSNTLNLGNFQVPNIVILDWDDNFGFTRIDIENSSKDRCSNSSERVMGGEDATGEVIIKPMIADVYPNPSTSTFRVYLALADQQQIDLQLFSIDGRKLLDKRISQTRGIVPIDAASYKPGVYLLTIRQGSFNKTIKLIKQ
ncbi:MAG: S8 family serine peptidase [Chitinophagaceae bacterium]